MSLDAFRQWLFGPARPVRRRTSVGARPSRALRFYSPSLDVLEDRRLLTVSVSTGAEAAAQAAPLAAPAAQIVARNIFYNNSRFDAYTPQATAADDSAIATDKTALLPGQTATFANYTSFNAGINGIMIDVAGLRGVPTASDFLFRVGNGNDPSTWAVAPAPSSVTVRAGAGVNGSDRITIIWPDASIRKTWLQVDVRATTNTGLQQPDVFYFGNAVGESGNVSSNAVVDLSDQLGPRGNPRGLANPVPLTSVYDYNRDGLVSAADELIAQNNSTSLLTSLRLITPPANAIWADVVARQIFYNNSQFDGNNANANAADDGAIATDKTALLPGSTATFQNYTSYSRGINGIMIDIVKLPQTPTLGDFEFRVGNDNSPVNWALAPAPSSISVRPGAGVNGSARVTIMWPDNVIQNQWLQVTVKAMPRTGLANPDVFLFGNAIGETGDSSANAVVGLFDQLTVRVAISSTPVPVSSRLDINRNGVVDVSDLNIVYANSTTVSTSLRLISLASLATDAALPTAALPISSVSETTYVDFVSASVVARKVFYNNSQFDGNNPAANSADDQAIATDKSALLPGSTASFANYTSYSRGINGLMIDVAGLPDVPTADDFVFRVGNSSDPTTWSTAPAPTSITVRQGSGVGGSARITIVWPDNTIQNEWLQVTLKAAPRTGLKTADTFYFGNQIGESGNSATDAKVNTIDQIATRDSPYTIGVPAPVTVPYDYNRDSIVDVADEWIAQRSTSFASLRLISTPATIASPSPSLQPVELFNHGDGGYNVAFAPNLVKANDGTLLAIAEGRSGNDDSTTYAIIMRRSTDNGVSWSAISTIYSIQPFGVNHVGNPSAVVDAQTGRISVLFSQNTSTIFVVSSTNSGLTWSAPTDITSSIKVTSAGNPNPAAFPSDPWGWYVPGPGHGIQIQNGPYAGRLLIAADHRLTVDSSGPSWSNVIYSDDHGLTWHLGGGLNQADPNNAFSNEASLVEQSDGSLYMSIRINGVSVVRGYSRSFDGGQTWTTMQTDPVLTSFRVEASLLRVNANTVLLSAPDEIDGNRQRMTLWASYDNMQTWVKTKVVFYGYAAYSDMVLIGNDTVLLSFTLGQSNGDSNQHIGLVRFNLRWLQNADPAEFDWYFNEQQPGQLANTQGTSIQDYGPWDSRAQPLADTPALAPQYIAGPNANDSALRLTKGSDLVQMTPANTGALQFSATDSFTIQLVIRTTDTDGVILGSVPNMPGWTLQLVGGHLQFSLNAPSGQSVIQSMMPINDGNWHQIAAVRNTSNSRLFLYVDRVLAAVPVTDSTKSSLQSNQPITLGGYNNGTAPLAFDVDLVRVTRAALFANQLIPANFVSPPRAPAPVYSSDAPNTLSNLQLWLPAYNRASYFSDLGYSNPLPLSPVNKTAVHSAIDASANHYQATISTEIREILYTTDPVLGPVWDHTTNSPDAANAWTITNSNGTSPSNFDFVQDTGVFTLSAFVKLGPSLNSSMTLFDTDSTTSANPGFSLIVWPNGTVNLVVTDNNGTIRFSEIAPAAPLGSNTWYHIAVVGHGAGQPVTYYITPANGSAVASYTSATRISGANGDYPTDANHNLTVGSQSNTGHGAFNGQMVDEAIYNRALSDAEIQQLFNYTKGL